MITTVATFRSACWLCGEWTNEGDEVALCIVGPRDKWWGHPACVEAMSDPT